MQGCLKEEFRLARTSSHRLRMISLYPYPIAMSTSATKPSPAIDRLMRQLVIPLVLLLGLYGLLRHATTGHGHRPGAEPPARFEGVSAML